MPRALCLFRLISLNEHKYTFKLNIQTFNLNPLAEVKVFRLCLRDRTPNDAGALLGRCIVILPAFAMSMMSTSFVFCLGFPPGRAESL